MSDSLKTKLKQVEDDLSQLRSERADKVKARDAAKAAFEAADVASDKLTESAEFKAVTDAVKGVGEIDDKIHNIESAQVGILKALGQSDPADTRQKATDEQFISDEDAARLKAVSHSHGRFGQIDLGEVVSKATLAVGTNARRSAFGGAYPMARRQLTLLDVIPTGTMDNNSFPYVQEGGTYAAAETTEASGADAAGQLKPEAGITLTDAQADAATIAHWKKLSKQSLEDVGAVRALVDSHLRYGVLRRLEGQILVGNGTAPNIRGIRNTSGIQTQAFAAGPIASMLLQAIAKVFIAEGQADAVVVNPADWASLLAERDGSGGAGTGGYLVGGDGSAVGSPTATIWGVPLIPNASQPAGFATVGDFGMGATLLVRSGVQVLVSDSDQDDFIRNRVTLLGEMRAGLAVWRPSLFVDTDIVTP